MVLNIGFVIACRQDHPVVERLGVSDLTLSQGICWKCVVGRGFSNLITHDYTTRQSTGNGWLKMLVI